MRYRSISSMSDLTQDYVSFLELISAGEYRKLLTDIGRGLNNKGYVTAFEDHRFFLELQLLNLDLEYIKSEQRLTTSLPQQLHEAVDFVCGVGQTITNLSYQARKTLRGQIIGGLKTNGLRPLQHEFRVAAQLSNQGYQVSFPDLEGLATFDLSTDLKGQEFEIEAKSVSIFLGRPIDPDRAERFFDEVRKGFVGWSDGTEIPVIDVLLKSGLPATRQELLAIVEACISSARAMRDQYVNANCQVRYVGAVPDAPHERLAAAAREDWIKNGVIAFVPTTPPKVIIRLHSAKKDKFRKSVRDTISEASKTQLTSYRPAAVMVNIELINAVSFDRLSNAATGGSQLDTIANSVFGSESHRHIVQLGFSGGPYLRNDGEHLRSSFNNKIYNNPNSKFKDVLIFTGGVSRRTTSE